ncbi:MAG: hypothetical protein NVS1B2_11470 [Vulcanimicrobiaceae bacterium]
MPAPPDAYVASSLDIRAVCDDAGSVLSVNEGWTTYTGLLARAALGQAWRDVVHPDDAGTARDAWDRGISNRAEFSFDSRIRRHDGAYRWRVTHVVPLPRDRDEARWAATSVDIDRGDGLYDVARAEAAVLPHTIWHAEPDGYVVWFNSRWHDLTGSDVAGSLGWGWAKYLHPADLDRARGCWEAALQWKRSDSVRYRLRVADGTYRWVDVTFDPLFDAGGSIRRWVGSVTDIDDAVRAHERIDASERRYRTLAESLPQLVWVTDVDGTPVYFNRRWFAFTGQSEIEAFDGPVGWVAAVHDDDRPRTAAAWQRSVALGSTYEVDYRLWHAPTLAYRWVVARGEPERDVAGAITGWVGTSTDIDAHKRAEDGNAFLNGASELLATSLDLDETMRAFARIVVPSMATWCAVFLLDEARNVVLKAIAHDDRGQARFAEELVRRYPLRPQDPVAEAALRGETFLIADIADELLIASAQDDEHLHLMRQLDLRSTIIVPLVGREGAMGALQFVNGRTSRRFDEADVAIVEMLARHVSSAIENARLFERERRVADLFQRAALPAALPSIAGVRLDSDYEAARDEATIGGDWYDAFEVAGDLIVTIGDVAGKGLEAAVLMASLRQTMRTVGHADASPVAILAGADRALRRERPDSFATAFVARYRPAFGTLTYALAGHPPPYVRRADGTIERLAIGGQPLGLFEHCSERTIALERGDMLVAFTDGLVESERDMLAAEVRLVDVLRDDALVTTPRPARFVRDAMLAARANDDVAILTLAIADEPVWSFVGEGAQLHGARAAVVRALETATGDRYDLALAEAIAGELTSVLVRRSNGPAEMALVVAGDAAALHVFDRDVPYDATTDLLDTREETERGLSIVRACADRFDIRRHSAGGNHATTYFRAR